MEHFVISNKCASILDKGIFWNLGFYHVAKPASFMKEETSWMLTSFWLAFIIVIRETIASKY